jgi:hypothetical protein
MESPAVVVMCGMQITSSIYPYRSHDLYFTHDLIDVRARKVVFYAREGLFRSQSEAETFLAYSLGFAEKPGQTNFGFPTKTSARSPQAGLFFGDKYPPSRSHESTHAATIVFHRVSFDLKVFRVR